MTYADALLALRAELSALRHAVALACDGPSPGVVARLDQIDAELRALGAPAGGEAEHAELVAAVGSFRDELSESRSLSSLEVLVRLGRELERFVLPRIPAAARV